MGEGWRLELVTPTHGRPPERRPSPFPVPTPLPALPHGQDSQPGPMVTHLVALLSRVPLGASLSSGTLSPQRTRQLEPSLSSLRPQGWARTRSPHVHSPLSPPSLTAGPGGPGRPSDPGGPWGHDGAESVTLTGGGGDQGTGAESRRDRTGRGGRLL